MRLVRFLRNKAANSNPSIGSLNHADQTVTDLTAGLASAFGSLHSMRQFLTLGEPALAAARKAIAEGKWKVPLNEVRLLAPIGDAEKVICIGMNYVDHCVEQNQPIPTEPVIFSKFSNTVIGTGDPILYNSEMKQLDYEVELVVVIGKGGKYIPKERASEHIVGYSVAHDVSERYWQFEKNGKQWALGKTFDAFSPLSPEIVTPDEISDINKLGLRCIVNGNVMQNGNTSSMIFKPADLVAWCSKFFTLTAGDIILTGTPPGVGVFRKPPVFLKPGDVVTCEIDELGSVSNPIVREVPQYTSKL